MPTQNKSRRRRPNCRRLVCLALDRRLSAYQLAATLIAGRFLVEARIGKTSHPLFLFALRRLLGIGDFTSTAAAVIGQGVAIRVGRTSLSGWLDGRGGVLCRIGRDGCSHRLFFHIVQFNGLRPRRSRVCNRRLLGVLRRLLHATSAQPQHCDAKPSACSQH